MELFIKNGVSSEIYYIDGGNGLNNIIVNQSGNISIYYTYTDHLGSIVAVTNEAGTIVAEQNFDAWGRYRNPANWTYTGVPARPDWLYRGFTGHEHLAQFALINMNGRMYDPMTGMMMSPDNYVPMPWSPGGYNRYGYANGNPMKYIDPDGEFFWLPLIIGAIIGGYGGYQTGRANGASGWNMVGYIAGGATIGGLSGGAAVGVSALGGGAMLAGAAAGIVGGAGFGGLATGWNVEAMIRGAGIGGTAGLIGGGMAAAIGGGAGAFFGGAMSDITSQLLSTGNLDWGQVGVSAALSFGLYHAMTYARYEWGGGNNLGGKHISYSQFSGMNADYQRSRFWQKENGGYLMTDGSLKRVPNADEHYLGVDFKSPPKGAWASYHTHWAHPGTTYQVTLPNYDKPTTLDLLLKNYVSGIGAQYHDAQDLTISGNTYVINRFDGSFHPYGAANYYVLAPDPFIRFFMFPFWR